MYTHKVKGEDTLLQLLNPKRGDVGQRAYMDQWQAVRAFTDNAVEAYDPMANTKEGELVLVRDNEQENWKIARYAGLCNHVPHDPTNYVYRTYTDDAEDTTDWMLCIPFKGNEHLAFTEGAAL